jgi:tRNA (mo5U34)-methyltransferase
MEREELQANPTDRDDTRLAGWYHTVDLGAGLCSRGDCDLRSTVDLHGFPDSLKGKTALDVGTTDGFWAFEMERRGAEVVAIEESKGAEVEAPSDGHFWIAHEMRGSTVQHKLRSVYDLSPDSMGVFDVVFCGSLLLHLEDPLKALVNIRSVTKEMAIVVTLLDEEIERHVPSKPWLSVGNRPNESRLGETCIYWKFGTHGLQELMEYAGFSRAEPLEPVPMPPTQNRSAVVVGYP